MISSDSNGGVCLLDGLPKISLLKISLLKISLLKISLKMKNELFASFE